MKTNRYHIVLIAVATFLFAACTSEDATLSDAIANGTVVPTTIGSVSVEGASSANTAKAATRTLSSTTTQPNTVVEDFSAGDVFKVEYENRVTDENTVYARKQTDGSWKTYADEACTSEQTIYLNAKDGEDAPCYCTYSGFNGSAPEGQESGYSYITKAATTDTRGSLKCYDYLECEPTITPTADGNKIKSSIAVNFTHLNYLLMLNVAKVAEKSALKQVNTVTVGLKATSDDNTSVYYDVASTSTGAAVSTDGITNPEWRVILPSVVVADKKYNHIQVASITIKGTVDNGTEWTYAIDLEKSGQTFATAADYSRVATINVAERLTLSLGATLYGWADVEKGEADVSTADVYDFDGYTSEQITSKLAEIKASLNVAPKGSVKLVIKNLTAVPDDAFEGCTSLTSVSLPNATTIGASAFYYCENLASVSLPAATTIGAAVFRGCTNLTSVSLPAATTIGKRAFNYCTNLASVNLPKVTTTGELTFYDCTNLTSVSLPKAESIGDKTFYYCENLASVSLPAATTIGTAAFWGCKNLTSVSLPAATTIGRSVFNLCPLTSLDLSATGNITLDSNALGDFTNSANCTLTLCSNKKNGGTSTPAVDNDGKTWDGLTWKTITYTVLQ